MDLIDFFFPEQAQAAHLRRIANRSGSSNRSVTLPDPQAGEIAELRQELKFLTLVVTTILKRLSETQTLSLDDVQDMLTEIDGLDGMSDGGLDPGVLRGLLGVLRQNQTEAAQANPNEFRIVTTPRYRGRS